MDVFPSFFIFLFNKLNIFVDLKNIFCYTCVMKTSTLGKLLELPNFHHFYTVPIRENTESSGNYIIVFEQDKQPVFVDLKNETGHTREVRFASHFDSAGLLVGLGAIPINYWPTCQILGVKKNNNRRGLSLSSLMDGYGRLPIFKEMAERYRARGQSTIYDPYRYSYTIDEKKVIKDNQLTLIPKKEYEKIKDFHPFLQTKHGNVYAVPCFYQDRKRNQITKIYIIGWYFYEKQLKISWKPSHSRKSRWRSSLVSVDKLSDRFFFQGELYKKGTYPVFLEDLTIKNKAYQHRLDREFAAFLSIIEEQKRRARLRVK
ncbi:hypothetical protein ACSBRS_005200 [Streptococcus suis]|uniref:hypothetical protein n=1 Tax=Streptococcus suis TaxID=1307 RepID=UPI00137ACCA0|nr:hypothetical protein [Streptococcus suis]